MNAYVDASVLLRLVLGQRGELAEWPDLERGVTSELTLVECVRTLDRLRLHAALDDDRLARQRAAIYRILEALEVVALGRGILERATQPLPTALGTLDALHLATALLWREREDASLVMATHDGALATAARAMGLVVVGT